MTKPHPLQIAWAAGVFEGKGAFPKSGYTIRFESKDEPMVQRFHATVGVGAFVPREHSGVPMGTHLFVTSSMDDTRTLMLLLSPFLSPIRLKQAADMVSKIERNKTWQKKFPEKAASSVTSPAPSAVAKTTGHFTTQDGHTATAPNAPTTGDQKGTTGLL